MRNWFLPDTPDVLASLREQSDITCEGMAAFVTWAQGDPAAEPAIREAEHRADDAKRAVHRQLRVAFSTPLDPEDIYALSERLDTVMNAAKNIVREADVMAMAPDGHMAEMAAQLSAGMIHLRSAIGHLGDSDDGATEASDRAVRTCRELERLYRTAMSELLVVADLREVMGRREMYRRFSRTADAVERVSERVWYAVVKSP